MQKIEIFEKTDVNDKLSIDNEKQLIDTVN